MRSAGDIYLSVGRDAREQIFWTIQYTGAAGDTSVVRLCAGFRKRNRVLGTDARAVAAAQTSECADFMSACELDFF